MRRDYRVVKEPTVMIIPMIDIMLFLLVFFMISTIYMVQANTLPVNLPAAAAARRETRPRIVAVTVQADGTVQYERDSVRVTELSARVRQALANDAETVFVLRGDKATTYDHIVAVLDVVALGILNVPMAVTWGVLSFITNYIPNIGFFVGVIPPALLALVDSGPLTALWVIVAYTVLNFVIQSLIQPKFTGDAVGLNTTTTFLSLLFWSQVIGALGAILAVPLTLFAKAVLIDTDPRSRWISLFLSAGDEPVRRTEQLDAQEVDALDLDGDGIGPADPQYGTPAVALDEAGGAARATTADRPGAAAAEEGKG